MGLGFQLEDETEIDVNIARALRTWILWPGYGHDLGTSFLDAMTSLVVGKIIDPREEAHRILNFFISK